MNLSNKIRGDWRRCKALSRLLIQNFLNKSPQRKQFQTVPDDRSTHGFYVDAALDIKISYQDPRRKQLSDSFK